MPDSFFATARFPIGRELYRHQGRFINAATAASEDEARSAQGLFLAKAYDRPLLDGHLNRVAEADGIEDQPVLDLELLRLILRQPDLQGVITFVAPERLCRGLRR